METLHGRKDGGGGKGDEKLKKIETEVLSPPDDVIIVGDDMVKHSHREAKLNLPGKIFTDALEALVTGDQTPADPTGEADLPEGMTERGEMHGSGIEEDRSDTFEASKGHF